jgi:hypothetical protein
LGTAISNKTAQGVVEGVELAAPVAREYVKEETKSLLHSKAAVGSYIISSGLVFALVYRRMERARRLVRIEEKLDEVVDEVADEEDDASTT